MANSSIIAAFAATMAVVALVSVLLFVLRAEKVRKTGMRRNDVRMIAFLVLAIGSLFAFSISFAEIAETVFARATPGTVMAISGGVVGLFLLALAYEIYQVLASRSTHARRMFVYVLSFLIFIVGMIIGLTYYTKQDPESKHVGKMCIILAVVGVPFWALCVLAIAGLMRMS